MRAAVRRYIGDLFFTRRFYNLLGILSACFLLGHFFFRLRSIPFLLLAATAALVTLDYILLFFSRGTVQGRRQAVQRFSNGDDNRVSLSLHNSYGFPVQVDLIDEVPALFQRRDIHTRLRLAPGGQEDWTYALRPVRRGAYEFRHIRAYAMSPLGLLQRRFITGAPEVIKVYPAYMQLRKYQLMAETNRWNEGGIRRRRRLGHSMEFEQIRDYVPGDDYRTLNWTATARSGRWMVNDYTEEKSQQIYCLIDKGRAMKMPFEGMTLLDYAINTSLVLLNVALHRQDKAGLLTFAEGDSSFLAADKRNGQMQAILEILYRQKTQYLESDFEKLYITVRRRIPHRSLLVLFTNFETLSSLRRQLPYLQQMARYHLLLLIFFENTELKTLLDKPAADIEAVYTGIIAEKFAYEKKLIAKELRQAGILTLLTTPQQATIGTINKYLELKSRQML